MMDSNHDHKLFYNSDKMQWIMTNHGARGVAPPHDTVAGTFFNYEDDECPNTILYTWWYARAGTVHEAGDGFSLYEQK